MTSGKPDEAAPVFEAVLRPYRSLSPTGFMLVMLLLVGCSFTAGLAFWMMGAWPIVGFFGLDIALVQVAFRLNYRAARACEEVTLTRDRLTVTRVAANGRTMAMSFNPYWARLEIERDPDIGVSRVTITSHGNRLDVGAFLPPKDRASFAAAFASALAVARAAPAV
jgi:uncharacterized membrane protein